MFRREHPEFTVEEVGDSYPPWGIIYREGDRVLRMPSFEVLGTSPTSVGIRVSDLRAWDGGEKLTAEDKARVMRNIQSAYGSVRVERDER
jgi:hypothetical protein